MLRLKDATTTRWHLVIAASRRGMPGAREAFGKLIAKYWDRVYAFVRIWHHAEEAHDLTQGFFADVLERNDLERFVEKNDLGRFVEKHDDIRPPRGWFRSWLRLAAWRHLIRDWKWKRAKKRGGGVPPVSLDALDPESRCRMEPAHDVTPARLYERRRALDLLARVLDRLREEYERRNQGSLFEKLKGCLVGNTDELQEQIAAELGKTPVAFRQDVHRFKHRYRKLLDAALAESAGGEDKIEQERRRLIEALVALTETEAEPE